MSDEAMEKLARAVHGDYVRRTTRRGRMTDGPSTLPWESLPESLKRSNRAQAADILRKLARIGCGAVSASRGEVADFAFDDDQIEVLAKMEHDRWVAERTEGGWTHGSPQDAVHLRSPYLVKWEELSEEVRDLDRDAVRAIPWLLASAGLAVSKKRS
jgi:RyR domain